MATVEKILAAHSAKTGVTPGDFLTVKTDFVFGNEQPGAFSTRMASTDSAVTMDRGEIDLDLLPVEGARVAENTEMRDDIQVDRKDGGIANHAIGKTFTFTGYREFMMETVDAGGLIEYTRRTVSGGRDFGTQDCIATGRLYRA